MSKSVTAMQKTVEQAEAIARAAFDAVEEMRWMDVVALIHPVALERFRQTRLYNEKHMEESKASRPRREGMPEEVAKWFEQQDEAVDYSPEEHRSRMYGVRTIEELEALSTDELASRFLAAGDPRTHLRRQIIEQAGADDSELDGRQLGGERFEIVGSVVENPDTIHVLYRTTMSTSAPEQGNLDVASVMHMPDGWRLWPRREEPRLFGGFTYWVQLVSLEDVRRQRQEAVAATAIWSTERGERRRARLTGYLEDSDTVRALTIEAEREDGWQALVEVPPNAFERLHSMIIHFASVSDVE